MTNYRRLISYIYAYEGEVKGKNIGFAKLESRNGQCKLSVNVKKVYVGSSDLGVYLLAPGKEIFLGSIFIRSGGGEFRAVVNVENAADSGCSMDQCYGLTIHEQGDTWRAYTTIWEDAVAHAAEVELADVTSSKVGDAEAQIHRKVEELNQELRSGEKTAKDGDGPVLSSSPAGARQMSDAVRQSRPRESFLQGAADSEIKDVSGEMLSSHGPEETLETMQEAEDTAETMQEAEVPEVWDEASEEVFGAEDEAGQASEASGQITEKTAGLERIMSEPAEAGPAGLSGYQEMRDESDQQINQETEETVNQMEAVGNPQARDHMELEPELLPDTEGSMELEPESLPDEMPGEAEEVQESGDIPDSQLESQSEKEAESEPLAPEKTAVLQNKSLAGIMPAEDVEQTDGMMTPNAGGEQEPDPRPWNGKWNIGEQQIPQHNWDEKNVTSIRKQLHEENETMPREPHTGHAPLDKGVPGQGGMAPDTRIPLQPDNMPESRTVPRPNIMTRPGMPRRHMPSGTMNTGSAGGQSDQERLTDQYPMNQQPSQGMGMTRQQPMGNRQFMPGQHPTTGQQPIPGQEPMPGEQPMPGRQPMSEQQPMPGQQPIPGQRPMPGQQPIPGQQSMPGRQPMSGRQPTSGQQPMPERQPVSEPQPIPGQQPMPNQQSRPSRQMMPYNQPMPSRQQMPGQNSMSQQPVPNRQPMPNRQPVPNRQATSNQQAMPNRQPAPNRQATSNRQPMPNQQPAQTQPPGSQTSSQGRQPLMGPGRWEADSSGEAAGQAEDKVPVVDAGEETLILGNPQELERLEQEEQQSDFPGRLWDGFRKRYPKIQAFDSANGCEILTIKPQDIGLLPRENWNYGNNSFLLHGYYNYRYLILARIGDETKGRTRYILGVPGNYYSNEKYMASMFGFPHFVLARKQPSQDGRFGYWYTDVRLENQD